MRLDDLHARVVELLRARAQSSPQVRLDIGSLSDDIRDSTVRIDRDQLAQAVLNIAGNAIAAMHGEGSLRLTLDVQDDDGRATALLRLENDGPAIPKEDLERIFDPFYTRSDQGTGLGLPIAERIVEAHDGFIRVENLEDRGVAFTIILPMASSATAI